MDIQPTYRVQPAAPNAGRPPLSLRRLGRFFLLVLFSAAVFDFNLPLMDADGWVSRWFLDYRFSDSQAEAMALIIIVTAMILAAACATTLILDSLSFLHASPQLRRWASSGYWSTMIVAAALAFILAYVLLQDPCAGPKLCPYIG